MTMPDPRHAHCPELPPETEYEQLGEVAATSNDPAVVFLALAAQGVDLFGDPDEVLGG